MAGHETSLTHAVTRRPSVAASLLGTRTAALVAAALLAWHVPARGDDAQAGGEPAGDAAANRRT